MGDVLGTGAFSGKVETGFPWKMRPNNERPRSLATGLRPRKAGAGHARLRRSNRRPSVSTGEKKLTGRIAPERIRLMTVPRPPAGVVERFLALGDPSGVISDAMDEL